MQDSVGQDYRGRYVLSEGSTQKVRLDSVRQECALCCQGKVHWKTPGIVSKLRKRSKSSPRRKVPEHVKSEGIVTPLDGDQWAIKEPVLMGQVEPMEAPIKLQSFRLERRRTWGWSATKKCIVFTSSEERRETWKPQQDWRCFRIDVMIWWKLIQGIWKKKKRFERIEWLR